MKKKQNIWPWSIVIAFVLFATFIGYLVKGSMAQSVDLVSTDYYEKEIRFQEQIDKAKRANELGVKLDYDFATKTFSLQANKAVLPARVHVHFLRPSDVSEDVTQEHITNESYFVIPITELKKGKWKAQVELETTKGVCYVEKEFVKQ